jgi:hypothetical protein
MNEYKTNKNSKEIRFAERGTSAVDRLKSKDFAHAQTKCLYGVAVFAV